MKKKTYIKDGAYQKVDNIKGKVIRGALDLSKEILDVLVDKGLITTEDCCTYEVAGGSNYLVYTALLTQTGTDAPVATVLENTLGGTVVWTRNDVGDYTGTLAGVFTANKTFMLAAVNGETSSTAAIVPYTIGVNSIGFYSMDSTNNVVELNGGCFFEIRVYP